MVNRDLVIQQRDGKLYALTDPDVCEWAVEVIERASPALLSVEDGVATLRLADETRRYRLGEPVGRLVKATRIRDEERP